LQVLNRSTLTFDNATWTMTATSTDPFDPTVQLDGDAATRPTIALHNLMWTNAGGLRNDTGKITIGAGSTVTNTFGMLAFDSIDDAEVEVDGGTWDNTGRLTVGAGGKAKLTVKNGGIVKSNTAIIADDASSVATMIVDGAGSNWQNTGTLSIGDTNGPGTQATLVLRDGGQLSSTGTIGVLGKGVLSGTGMVTGAVSSSATVDPGYIDELTANNVTGTLAINGNYTQTQGKLKIDLGPGGADKLDVSGNISLIPFFTGTVLEIAFSQGFYPGIGQTFDILDWDGTLTGTFTNPQLPVLTGGRVWDLSQLYTTGVISVAGTSTVPGDFNGNGFADAADYVMLRRNPGSTPAQYAEWRGNFGNFSGAGAGGIGGAAVPEPAAILLISAALVAAPYWRRR
jgi:T5SS/PEP-CTERM-associated repeat protein